MIEFIKRDFGNYFQDVSTAPEGNVENTDPRYNNRRTHCRSGMYTFTKMIKPKHVLEIGSMVYDSSNMIGMAMDEMGIDGVIDSIDIVDGGCHGQKRKQINKRIRPRFWLPHHTSYDKWKYSTNIAHPEFKDMSNEEIFSKNLEFLRSFAPIDGYDMILIDGDHSYEGVSYEWQYANRVSHPKTLMVIDDMYDSRHWQVRKFYDTLQTTKWDFVEWNNIPTNPLQSTAITLPEGY